MTKRVTNSRNSFGPAASRFVAARLDEAGIEFHASIAVRVFEDGALRIDGNDAIACDHAVGLPRLVVDEIPGLPQNRHGFLATDVQMQVMTDVWAAGDATTFPVKQGGLASRSAPAVLPRPGCPGRRGRLRLP